MAFDDLTYELVKPGFTLRITLTASQTVCTACYIPTGTTSVLTDSGIRQFLASHSIKESISTDAVEALLQAAALNKRLDNVVVAQGIPMQPGADSCLELLVPDALAEENAESERDEPLAFKAVNFKKVQSFYNVESGDCVGIIRPPTAGTAGKTVQSKIIPVVPGKAIRMRTGKGIRLGEDGCTLYADLAGRVHNSASGLTVENVYTVKGDVDYHTGNITFNGLVEITGDVLDGFEVNATKGIKIRGVVGNARLTSNGSIDIGGISGAGIGSIYCGGDLKMKYCNDSSVTAEGNITVQTEVRNSVINCLVTLTIKQGAFCGGQCIVLAGIEAASIGSKTALPTTVTVGVSYYDYNEAERLNRLLIELNDRFMANAHNPLALASFMEERNKLSSQLQQVHNHQYDTTNAKVNALKAIYENVRFKLEHTPFITTEEIFGPVTLISDPDERTVIQLQMSRLSVNATQLKEALRLEERAKQLMQDP